MPRANPLPLTSFLLLGKKKRQENYAQNGLNQHNEKSTVVDDHVRQGKAICSIPFREFPSQENPEGEEKEDQNRQIAMEARSKKISPQIEKKPQPKKKADPKKDIKSFSPSHMLLPREV
jgi:hypothetical protein